MTRGEGVKPARQGWAEAEAHGRHHLRPWPSNEMLDRLNQNARGNKGIDPLLPGLLHPDIPFYKSPYQEEEETGYSLYPSLPQMAEPPHCPMEIRSLPLGNDLSYRSIQYQGQGEGNEKQFAHLSIMTIHHTDVN